MIIRKILIAAVAASFVTLPAMAQTSLAAETNGHHYQGGPKTEVPHHMGAKETVGLATNGTTGGHHYAGGPNTVVPHHMAGKQQ